MDGCGWWICLFGGKKSAAVFFGGKGREGEISGGWIGGWVGD